MPHWQQKAKPSSKASAQPATSLTECVVRHFPSCSERRTPEWIMNQMLNPEQMIKEDPLAKAMFERYLVPMTFQNLTQMRCFGDSGIFPRHDSK